MSLVTDMPPTMNCPPLEDLWPAAIGEQPTDQVAAHARACERCASRTSELAAQIAAARQLCACPTSDLFALIETLPAGAPAGMRRPFVEDPSTSSQALRLPTIGKYPVFEVISRGGQATVYRGLHPSLLIEVAIKWSHTRCETDDLERARLVSEGQLLAELQHPHLARVYDLDFCNDRPFLVLDFIRGQQLRTHRDGNPMPNLSILQTVTRIARAVAAAHESGILHLDLKPDNIVLDRDSAPILIDFGLSSRSQGGPQGESAVTGIAGTPEYMAPEQARGLTTELSPRTDVYGLGAILYFLCTGRDPGLPNPPAGSLIRCPSSATIVDWTLLDSAPVSQPTKAICRRAMACAREDRYASTVDVAESLEREERRLLRSQLWRRRGVAFLIGLAGALMLVSVASGPTTETVERAPIVYVWRANQELPLAGALPLRAGDRIRVETLVRDQRHVAQAVITPGHVVWCRPLGMQATDVGTIALFPRDYAHLPYESEQHPLVMLVVMRNDRPIRQRDIDCLTRIPDCPAIPLTQAIQFGPDESKVVHRGDGQSCQPSIQGWLKAVEAVLKGHFEEYRGIILPPLQPSDPSSDVL